MRPHLPVIIATHAAAFVAGYHVAPGANLDEVVEQSGFFQIDTRKVLSATVDSLRAENKLQVFSYRGSATVSVTRSIWWIFKGEQKLMVPAAVSYYVDLSEVTLDNVSFDEKAKIVTVKLPRVTMDDIAFQPENATTINGGLLTYSDSQVEELRKRNYANARRALTAQAQGKSLLDDAKARAKQNITTLFEVPLRIAGQTDVKVVATFD